MTDPTGPCVPPTHKYIFIYSYRQQTCRQVWIFSRTFVDRLLPIGAILACSLRGVAPCFQSLEPPCPFDYSLRSMPCYQFAMG